MIIQIPNQEEVNISVFDLLGRRVKTLRAGILREGIHQFWWDGKDPARRAVPSGAYICSASTKTQRATVRVVLLR